MSNHKPLLATFSAKEATDELDCDGKRYIIFHENTTVSPLMENKIVSLLASRTVHNFQKARKLECITSLSTSFSQT